MLQQTEFSARAMATFSLSTLQGRQRFLMSHVEVLGGGFAKGKVLLGFLQSDQAS